MTTVDDHCYISPAADASSSSRTNLYVALNCYRSHINKNTLEDVERTEGLGIWYWSLVLERYQHINYGFISTFESCACLSLNKFAVTLELLPSHFQRKLYIAQWRLLVSWLLPAPPELRPLLLPGKLSGFLREELCASYCAQCGLLRDQTWQSMAAHEATCMWSLLTTVLSLRSWPCKTRPSCGYDAAPSICHPL